MATTAVYFVTLTLGVAVFYAFNAIGDSRVLFEDRPRGCRKCAPVVRREHFRHPYAGHDLFQRRRRRGFGLSGPIRQPVRGSSAKEGVRHVPAARHEPARRFLGGTDGNVDRRRDRTARRSWARLFDLAGYRLRHGWHHRRGYQRLPSAIQRPLR